jgi:hypothetical protein
MVDQLGDVSQVDTSSQVSVDISGRFATEPSLRNIYPINQSGDIGKIAIAVTKTAHVTGETGAASIANIP